MKTNLIAQKSAAHWCKPISFCKTMASEVVLSLVALNVKTQPHFKHGPAACEFLSVLGYSTTFRTISVGKYSRVQLEYVFYGDNYTFFNFYSMVMCQPFLQFQLLKYILSSKILEFGNYLFCIFFNSAMSQRSCFLFEAHIPYKFLPGWYF